MSATRTDDEAVVKEDAIMHDEHETPSPDEPRHQKDSAPPDDDGGEARPGEDAPAAPPCAKEPPAARIEALLLSTDRPMTDGKIAELLEISLEEGGTKAVRSAIDELNAAYEESGRTFRIEAVAGGRQVLTLPVFGPILHRLHQSKLQTRLTPAALETLAIVAYRQPVLRADVESIRGVACGEVLRTLMERRMVKIVGRADELGRPMLYGTTKEFLRVFGLSSLDDLPQAKELREPAVSKDQIARPKSAKKNEADAAAPANDATSDEGDAAPQAEAAEDEDDATREPSGKTPTEATSSHDAEGDEDAAD